MNRKLIITVLAAIIVGVLGIYLWQRNENTTPSQSNGNTPTTQEEAIRQAQQYQPPQDVFCLQSLTPAVHKATGARYTFNDSCLAPGWEPER